ncbi:poly(beta-D-mannuronate) lyase [Roseimicrobium gellanilyticum]|uniref:Poly(Beta-D-mannuronate) lyase n=1 Tax=Roseimicrobium gellanilyticum TaxID=748857 RepID=A0A366HT85_9BACT|nr:polysaccharide lyase 6 family protein [Roseimicrobium gellanilyticum]RBP46133.1 poly(beta-D-mannuronate) lyase [Roseimicrobium gellanilyticum]
MRARHLLSLAVIGLSLQVGGNVTAAESRIAANDVAAFDAAVSAAKPGDAILLEAGEWKDVALVLRGAASKAQPITLRAATPGTVKFTGDSSLRLSGNHLVVEGLWFHNCFPLKWDVVMFREDSKKLANDCTLRDCAITQDSETKDSKERKWVSLYGVGHKVERCHFEGKTSKGTLLVAWLPEKEGEPPKHEIMGNYFGPRPKLGKNGGEIIRLGDSDTSMQDAACVVKGNLFEKCDGEVECISNKSCGNEYSGNTFIECQGTLTLRHGNRCLVMNNWFDGRHRKFTGGIRVIGEHHAVVGNHLQGLEGDGARTAICVMNGIKDSPANGYLQVKAAKITGNSILDCKHSIIIGYADEDVQALMPPECTFAQNTIQTRGDKAIELVETAAAVKWTGNRVGGGETGLPPNDGIVMTDGQASHPTAVAGPLPRAEVGVKWISALGK